MSVNLLTGHHSELLSLIGACKGSSESTLVNLPHCWNTHVKAQLNSYLCLVFLCSNVFSSGCHWSACANQRLLSVTSHINCIVAR